MTGSAHAWLCAGFTGDPGGPWLHAGFARDLTPEEAMRRIGVTPGPLGQDGHGVSAYAADGGTVLLERFGDGAVHDGITRLSAGTVAAVVRVTHSGADFGYYADGELITAFGLFSYRLRQGADPDRLADDLRALGVDVDGERPEFPGHPVAGALALAERATGVHLSSANRTAPVLTGGGRPEH
ncbi:DUF6461 domain-containing protein [Nonomuraea sp. NPDC049725]|uniref:DUF6461 domain-containing protein n=1 Tax=Nonomuraea sp. NPDC049725 TaxID=3154508 RepID=UPI003444B3C4